MRPAVTNFNIGAEIHGYVIMSEPTYLEANCRISRSKFRVKNIECGHIETLHYENIVRPNRDPTTVGYCKNCRADFRREKRQVSRATKREMEERKALLDPYVFAEWGQMILTIGSKL